MISSEPSKAHAMMLSKACEEDAWGTAHGGNNDLNDADKEAEKIVSWIVHNGRPAPGDAMDKLHSKAAKILLSIREYQSRHNPNHS